ncbi:MAG TPA: serine/threonine-protein kinase, partial [Bryobacteraceae bacterium]|nr:serine/threonine-protein kinase [Bryobacteraceae bacterium]
MAADEHAPKVPSTDHEDTVVFENSSALPAGTILPAGTLLKDRYLLIRLLNEGGFGAVYLAHDQQMHGRPVVVKIQIDRKVDDPWFERKFNEEVRALSMIDHPGVVVAIDSGRTPDGKLFLVMQYVDGITLRAVMSPEGIPLDRAAKILQQVGHALGAAHEKGIWHRDLKPENLMLEPTASSGERVRLIDFGIATVADLADKFQTNTRVAGSDPYMAPEQRFGQPSALTDIYAMGLIAYEIVTGRKPFVAENAVQLVALQQAGVRVKPSDLRPALPLAAERLILQSLEYEPAKRPRDAREFGDRLHAALLDSEVTRITSSPDTRTVGSRKKWMIGSLAAAGALAVAGVYYDSHREPQPVPKQEPPAKSEAPAQDAASEQAIELAFWNSVKDSTEPQLYREYLAAYPEGRFKSLAKAKLEILARNQAAKPEATQTAARAKADNDAHEQETELTF